VSIAAPVRLAGVGRPGTFWLTVNKAELKNRRSLYERRVLVRVAEIVPARVGVRIVADRGFGDQNLYRLPIEELHFEDVIRFRGNIKVTTASGVTHTAAAWVEPERAGACAARGDGDSGSLSGWHRGMRARP
jgi:hypothetical protein